MARLGDRISTAWRKITLRRHRSELAALRVARQIGTLAIFPIMLTIAFWYLALGVPTLVPAIAASELLDSDSLTLRILGWAVFIPLSVYALAVVVITAPWFFRWYFIAAALMCGRTGMADRKEAELNFNLVNATTAEARV